MQDISGELTYALLVLTGTGIGMIGSVVVGALKVQKAIFDMKDDILEKLEHVRTRVTVLETYATANAAENRRRRHSEHESDAA